MSFKFHEPVMNDEIKDYLNLAPGKIIVDATIGTAGHSLSILEKISPGGKLVGIDRDEESLAVARERLKGFKGTCEFAQSNFLDLESVLQGVGVERIDGILFDLGVSSFQLENAERGFSFVKDGPLDMRLDRKSYISAYDLVNNLNKEEISLMLRNFGQERWHNRIARYMVEERQHKPIATTLQLSEIVTRAIPPRYRHRYRRIHPATRTFQAIRIAVNRELEVLEQAIEKAVNLLNSTARICIISFHSLEDRIAKHTLRRLSSAGIVKIITAKPLRPGDEETRANPKSRSAKLRVAERL
ncbi:16S rRNA (cytosine(1402)-N(4))-methyltransferase RsmH [Candidatus Omnitrophota bacterium]